MKRILSLLLACLTAVSLLRPAFALAAEETDEHLHGSSGLTLQGAGDYQYEEQEPNDSRSEAKTIGHDHTVTGTITWDVYMDDYGSRYYDLSDWFKFTVSSAGTVTLLAAAKYIDELEVEIYSSDGSLLYTVNSFVSTDGGNQILAFQQFLRSGTYYICVSGGKWETMSKMFNEYLLYLTIEPCTHQNTTGVVTYPTCTEGGYTTYTCVCGYRYTDDYTPAKGHTRQTIPGKKATCTESGLTEGVSCAVCGTTLTAQSSIPALGHRFGVWEVEEESTCTETGVYLRRCLRCDVVEREDMPTCSHKYGIWEWETEPSCEKEGMRYLECSLCGDRQTETVPALGHCVREWEITGEVSCEEYGLITETCIRCGLLYGCFSDPSGHRWSNWVTTKEPTCSELGSKERFCRVCDFVEQATIAKTAHKTVTLVGYEATCYHPGLTSGSVCSVCDLVTKAQTEIPQKTHLFKNTQEYFDTCYYCGLCRDSLMDAARTIPLDDGGNYHVYPDGRMYLKFEIPERGIVTVYATEFLLKNYSVGRPFCTILDENGYELYRNSDYVVYEVDTEQNDHTFYCGLEAGTYYLRVAAPWNHDNDLGYGLISDGILKDTGPHVKISFEANPFCETESNNTNKKAQQLEPGQEYVGYIGTDGRLEMCRDTFAFQTEEGHAYTFALTTNQEELGDTENIRIGSSRWNGENTFRNTKTYSFTAESSGTVIFYIERYDRQVQYKVTVGETHNYTSEVIAPTCLEQGYTLYSCPCGHSYQDAITAALNPAGHTEQVLEAREATCAQVGLAEGVGCSTCGAVLVPQEEIPSPAHREVVLEKIPATCTESGLTEGITCAVCNGILKEQLTIPVLGHATTVLKRVNATCTETGLTQGKVCIRCGIFTEPQEIIPMLNHTTRYLYSRNATCLETGLTSGWQCVNCGVFTEEQEVIPVQDHILTRVQGIEPTCTESGYTDGEQCDLCKTVTVHQEVAPMTGHSEQVMEGYEWCCESYGMTDGVKCSVCGEILVPQEVIPAPGHEYQDGECIRCGKKDPGYVEPKPEEPTLDGVTRIAGADRIGTSLQLADQLKEVLGVEKFDSVIVASALNFPDALTGSYLAAVKNAPILLTYEAAHPQIRSYIQQNLKPGGIVYILGGESAVSNSFATGLTGFNVKRVAGSDRFGTNLAIMREAGVSTTQPVLIATALNFADSLSASAAGLPMVLVYGSLRDDQKEFLATTSRNFIIIGGTSAVSADLENELRAIGSVQRLAGAGRYQTSVMVARKFVQNPDDVVLAYARNFPDGLCGGPLAYALGAPLILTDNYDPSEADNYTEGITAGIVVGGTGLISDDSVRKIFDLSAGTTINTK